MTICIREHPFLNKNSFIKVFHSGLEVFENDAWLLSETDKEQLWFQYSGEMLYLTLKPGQAIQVCSTGTLVPSGIICLWLGGLNMKLSLTVHGGCPVAHHPDFSTHIQFCFSET